MAERRRALVTGANGVFGRFICLGLLDAGIDVVCAARSQEKGDTLLAFLSQHKTGTGIASLALADISTGAGIAELAGQLGSEPLDILVNNAAITPETKQVSVDGEELQWAVNVLSYHRLMHALAPQLKAGKDPRAVFVASFYAGGLNLKDPQFQTRPYDADDAYQQSKQADRMLACLWSREVPFPVVSCHPGVATSAVSLGLGFDLDRSEKAQRDGAATPLYLASSPGGNLQTGAYYVNNSPEPCPYSQSESQLKALWELVEEQ